MPKKRWLPMHVSAFKDRHGKLRFRYRRAGYETYYFQHSPGSDEFLTELEACRSSGPAFVREHRAAPGSFDQLCVLFYQTPTWQRMAPNSQSTYRGIIERFRREHGHKPVALATTKALDKILGGMKDRPAAANNLRKVLKRLFSYAVKIGMRKDNPAELTDAFRTSGGFHTWTDEEIDQFRRRHPYGTKARLALELMLNTAGRRCNVAMLKRSDLRDGRFLVRHAKGGNTTSVPLLEETRAAIEAMPVAGIDHFLVTEFGKAFSVAGFGNWFRKRCDEADLPHCSAHGLRKAISRQLAEAGATHLQGRAVTGHKTDRVFSYYAEQADREKLADDALANLQRSRLANPAKSDGPAAV